MYQTKWHGIQFSSFGTPSSVNLARPEFYQAFYQEFFKRYQNWEQLDPLWLKRKHRWGDFILERAGRSAKVLSVGCGVGAVEHYMNKKAPQLELLIHEVAPSAWAWVGPEFKEERKIVGTIPACIPRDFQFDVVFLSGVDYALEDADAIELLSALRPFVTHPGGQCLLISASFLDPVTLTERAMSLARRLKAFAEAMLERTGLRPRQFWGWTRSQEEYRSLFRRAGYIDVEDGFIDSENRSGYWISGS